MKLWSGLLQVVEIAWVRDGSTVLQKLYLCEARRECLEVIDCVWVAQIDGFTVSLPAFRMHGGDGWVKQGPRDQRKEGTRKREGEQGSMAATG